MVLQIDLTQKISEPDEKKPTVSKVGIVKRIKSRLRVWQANFAKMPLGHKIILTFLATSVTGLGAIGLVYGFVIFTTPKYQALDTSYKLLEVQSIKGADLSYELPTPPKVKNHESPVNGLLFTKEEFDNLNKRKPLLAMIENTTDARPQAGFFDADLVYETLVESGVTRYMAVFWSKDAIKVGPIRSVRTYFLDWSAEYDDPPLANIGQAGYEPWEAVIVPEADARAYIIRYNVKSYGWYGRRVFWRDYDKFRSGVAWEHVAYSETETLWEDAETSGWIGPANVESLKFKKDARKDKRPLSQEIEIQFLSLGSETYKVKWTFDKDSNTYKRFLAGQPHIDENTNKQIFTKNIIIQHCQYRATGDRNGRIVFTTIGDGTAKIIRDGDVITGTWKKESRTARTHFFDSEGNEIELNRGKIWIEVVPVSGTKELSKITIQ